VSSPLRTLKLSLNDINSEEAMERLRGALGVSNLRELDLSYNPIGNAGMKVLAPALSGASTLEALDLTACEFTHIGAQPLFQILQRNQRLRTLVLDRNVLDGRRLKVLREFVANINGLCTLSMNHCHLGEEGAFHLSQGIIKSKRLKTLLLSGNELGDAGLASFAEYLGYSSFSLEHLDLSSNAISDEGTLTFAKYLSGNQHLLTVNFQRNEIGKEGGIALREAVGEHPNLTRL
jgi:NACHT/LRR/PYD domain-containing protein 3